MYVASFMGVVYQSLRRVLRGGVDAAVADQFSGRRALRDPEADADLVLLADDRVRRAGAPVVVAIGDAVVGIDDRGRAGWAFDHEAVVADCHGAGGAAGVLGAAARAGAGVAASEKK